MALEATIKDLGRYWKDHYTNISKYCFAAFFALYASGCTFDARWVRQQKAEQHTAGTVQYTKPPPTEFNPWGAAKVVITAPLHKLLGTRGTTSLREAKEDILRQK